MKWETIEGGVEDFRAASLPEGEAALAWLGQAGFALRSANFFVLVDPYLSDHLAQKYKGREFPHKRMMASPLDPEQVRGLDAVFCTHRHSDHMDPGTLPAIAGHNPECVFVVPEAEAAHAVSLGLPEARLAPMDAGETRELDCGVRVNALASAHEQLDTDESGHSRYLGFVIEVGGLKLYHSGDCVPYDGLARKLKGFQIDVALLPVNGRDAYRRERGVPGNMEFEEAVCLCQESGMPCLVPHHFDMFDFNTVSRTKLQEKAMALNGTIDCRLPSTDIWFRLAP